MLATIEAWADQIVEFVRLHEVWAAPIVFALAFGESLAFISLLVPAWGALVAIGYLIGPSGISFWPVCVAGALGAAFGDWLSYWVGIKLGPCLAAVAPPRPAAARRALHDALGRARHLHRAFLRTAAGLRAAGRRHPGDALLAVSARQFHLGLRLGLGAAEARRRGIESGCVDMVVADRDSGDRVRT
jgi:hypothetical protein